MTARVLKLHACGPSRVVQEGIAIVKRQIRTRDVRALATVMIGPGGEITTIVSGAGGAHQNDLVAGVERLRGHVVQGWDE